MTPIEIRPNRYLYLIPIVLALGLIFLFVYFTLFNPEGDELPAMMYVMTGFMVLVGGFLCIKLAGRFLKNEALLRIDDEGIESNEGGITSGLIRWSEIREVREIEIPWNGRASRTQTVLAVYLHDPEKQRSRYNPALRALTNFAGELMGASVLLTKSLLGNEYNRAVQAIRSKVPIEAAPLLPFEETRVEAAAAPVSSDPVVRFFKYLYDYRMGRQKADIRVYSLYLLFAAGIALGIFFPDLPVHPAFALMILLVVLVVYAVFKMRPGNRSRS
ncbi:MAG: hypothetical protein EOO11_13815 [Chitinophagaceae bacterium]|nr:MAG: hypothetical protein EOO11_13815 [Chitinophagaceae bacterium]